MFQHPGVYVEYLPSGLLAIEAASTSVAAFVGPVKRGKLNEPVFITSPSLFAQQFGVLDDGKGGVRDLGALPDTFGFAVNAFFNNGGSKAYIVPVGDTTPAKPAVGAVAKPTDTAKAYVFTARSDGVWANGLEVWLRQTDPNDANLGYTVEFGLTTDGRFKTLEQFSDLRLDPADPRSLVDRVNGQSRLATVAESAMTVGGDTQALIGAPLTGLDATAAIGLTLVVKVSAEAPVTITIPGTAGDLAGIAAAIQSLVRSGGAGARTGFVAQVSRDNRLVLVAGPPYGATSKVEVTGGTGRALLGLNPTYVLGAALPSPNLAGIDTKTLRINIPGTTPAIQRLVTFGPGHGTLSAAAAHITAQFARAPVAADGETGAASAFKAQAFGNQLRMWIDDGVAAQVIGVVTAAGDATALLGLGTLDRTQVPSTAGYPAPFDGTKKIAKGVLMNGADAGAPNPTDYRKAFEILRDYRDVSIILLPGQTWTPTGNLAIDEAITHAEYMGNRMVIVDPPDPRVSNELVSPKAFLDLKAPNSSFTALYYPWLTVANPFYDVDTAANKPKTFALPPSAFAAGLWARIDTTRGVWKAPAGLEATVRGAQGPNVVIGNEYQDNLNEWGVNCIRSIQGPAVLWGARTLASKAKPEFRYIPIRRTESMIGESLYRALQAVVFEPNDHKLWASLRASAADFMDGLFRSGAFQGEKASEAYFVRCGLNATMTQGDIDAGIVRLVVGFAPLKPAEFVHIQIQQIVGRTA